MSTVSSPNVELAGISARQRPRQVSSYIIIFVFVGDGEYVLCHVCISVGQNGARVALSVVYRGSSPVTEGCLVNVGYLDGHNRSNGEPQRGRLPLPLLCTRQAPSRGSVPPWSSADPSPWLMSNASASVSPAVQRVSQYIGVTGRNGSTNIRARGRVFRHFPCLSSRRGSTGILIRESRRNV